MLNAAKVDMANVKPALSAKKRPAQILLPNPNAMLVGSGSSLALGLWDGNQRSG